MKDLDTYIYDFLRSDEFQALLRKDLDVTFPVTFTYALERFVILHVKLYMLENDVRNQSLNNENLGLLKRKIDHLNGVIRPKLIESLGDMIAQGVKQGNLDLIKEPNMKKYGAIHNKEQNGN